MVGVYGGGGGGMVVGGGTNLPYTIQTSVRFGDFAELNLDQFSTNHVQIWRLYFFSLTGPR